MQVETSIMIDPRLEPTHVVSARAPGKPGKSHLENATDSAAITPQYPTWKESLEVASELDRAYYLELRSGQVVGYSSETLRWLSWLEAAVFVGHINTLLAAAAMNGLPECHTTIAELGEQLPFFPEPQIRAQLDLWQRLEDGLALSSGNVSTIQPKAPLVIKYGKPESGLPLKPIDRALRVTDACEFGLMKAAILFYLAVRTLLVGEWVEVWDFGASPRCLPPPLVSLIKRGQIKRHPKKKSLLRLVDTARLELPEVRWFANKRCCEARARQHRSSNAQLRMPRDFAGRGCVLPAIPHSSPILLPVVASVTTRHDRIAIGH